MGQPDFRFSDDERQSLADLLPREFHELSDPDAPGRSLVDRLVERTEDRIGRYKLIMKMDGVETRLTPARERAV
jgi:hypothetical protein